MTAKVTKDQFANNASWKFIELISNKAISLIISIVIARLLSPDAYGVVALTIVFITFSNIFILNGFNIALIRHDKVSDIHYSTVSILSILFATVLYVLIFTMAPFVAEFYKTPQLCSVLRVITLMLFFQSISSVIKSRGTRELSFKKMSVASFASNVIAGIIGVIMAAMGYGVWSLVAQQVLAYFFEMIFLIYLFKWKIMLNFSGIVAKEMLQFTFGVLGASFLDFTGNSAYSLVIGKTYSTTDLGYYNRGMIIPETISLNTYNAINSVLLPTLASRQNDAEDLKRVARKVLSFTLYVIFPLMGGLLVTAKHLVPFLLTDKWIPCKIFLQYSCIYYALNPIRAICGSIYYSKGESKRYFVCELIRMLLLIVALIFVVIIIKGNVYMIGLANVAVAVIMALIAYIMSYKIINYKLKEFIEDVLPSLIITVVMIMCVHFIGENIATHWVALLAQIGFGTAIYIGLSIVAMNSNFGLGKSYIKQLIISTKNRLSEVSIEKYRKYCDTEISDSNIDEIICELNENK